MIGRNDENLARKLKQRIKPPSYLPDTELKHDA